MQFKDPMKKKVQLLRHYALISCWNSEEGHRLIQINTAQGVVQGAAFHIIVFCELFYFIFAISVMDTKVELQEVWC